MNTTIENSKNVTIDVQTKLNIYKLSNNNLQIVYKNEDETTTSFIRNENNADVVGAINVLKRGQALQAA